jgi:hypothetical protein
MKHLVLLSKLTNLYLWGTGLTDEGMKELTRLPNLSLLIVYKKYSKVTDAGVAEFGKLLPGCKVVR